MSAFVGRLAAVIGSVVLLAVVVIGASATAANRAPSSAAASALKSPTFAPLEPTEAGERRGADDRLYLARREHRLYPYGHKGDPAEREDRRGEGDRLRFEARRGDGASVRRELQDAARRRNSQFPGPRGCRPEDLRRRAGCPGDRDRHQSEALHDLVSGRQQRRRRPDHRQGGARRTRRRTDASTTRCSSSARLRQGR